MRARQNGPDMGMVMLIMQVMRIGFENIGPVTMGLVVVNSVLFYYDLSELGLPSNVYDVCIGAGHIVWGGEYRRLILATLFHANSMHLYYNMSSLLLKGRLLEPVMGTYPFAWLVFMFAMLTSVLMVLASYFLNPWMPQYRMMDTCAVGFSGVLFALNTALPYVIQHPDQSVVYGIQVPTRYVTVMELLLISVLVPNASFLGHLCGIIVGYAFGTRYFDFIFRMPQILLEGPGARAPPGHVSGYRIRDGVLR
jgi:rhomboid domain-containing protein 1